MSSVPEIATTATTVTVAAPATPMAVEGVTGAAPTGTTASSSASTDNADNASTANAQSDDADKPQQKFELHVQGMAMYATSNKINTFLVDSGVEGILLKKTAKVSNKTFAFVAFATVGCAATACCSLTGLLIIQTRPKQQQAAEIKIHANSLINAL
jgi:hypothetical protein